MIAQKVCKIILVRKNKILHKNISSGASNGESQNTVGINHHTGNGITSHIAMHHHSNINPHSGISQTSHVHAGHHVHPGHGIMGIGGGGGSLADIHGLDLEAIGKINSGSNNNNNNGLSGKIILQSDNMLYYYGTEIIVYN